MVDPFLHCIYGPVDYIGQGSRAPDGHAEPSIVVEHRSVVTITPNSSNNITFALVSSPYGAIALDAGKATTTINTATVATGSFPYNYTGSANTNLDFSPGPWGQGSSVHSHYLQIPFSEWLEPNGTSIGNQASTGLQQSKFRVLSAQAKVAFTGNTLNDQGVACTGRLTFDFDQNLPATAPSSLTNDAYFLQYGAILPQQLPDSFSAIATLPGARIFPFKQSVNMINPPTSFAYQEMRSNWAPFFTTSVATQTKDIVFGGVINTTLTSTPTSEITGNDNVFGMGFAPVTFYAASGLDGTQNQSIVVETRTCVEYTIGFASPMARFASLPPPERPLAIRHAYNYGRLLPSSVPASLQQEEAGWLSKIGSGLGSAWDWYWPKEKAAITASWRAGGWIADKLTGGALNALGSEMGQLSIGYPNRRMIAG